MTGVSPGMFSRSEEEFYRQLAIAFTVPPYCDMGLIEGVRKLREDLRQ